MRLAVSEPLVQQLHATLSFTKLCYFWLQSPGDGECVLVAPGKEESRRTAGDGVVR